MTQDVAKYNVNYARNHLSKDSRLDQHNLDH